MSAEKRWRLVCYDIRDPIRYRKAYKIIRGTGERVQYSVFRCRLDDLEMEKLRWRLAKVLSPDDALLVVDLCPGCSRKVISRNHVPGWAEEPATFRIVAGALHASEHESNETCEHSMSSPSKDGGSDL